MRVEYMILKNQQRGSGVKTQGVMDLPKGFPVEAGQYVEYEEGEFGCVHSVVLRKRTFPLLVCFPATQPF